MLVWGYTLASKTGRWHSELFGQLHPLTSSLPRLIIIDDDSVVEEVLRLQDAVGELNDELQILHILGEL